MPKDVVLIAASVAALVLISVATFFCSRRRSPPSPSQRSDALRGHDVELGGRRGVAGLDEAVLAAYPTLVFSPSPAPQQHGGDEEEEEETTAKEKATVMGTTPTPAGDTARCAVCQSDYAVGDELRLIPECQHAFHRRCVDRWLRRRPTCPVCRASPPFSKDFDGELAS